MFALRTRVALLVSTAVVASLAVAFAMRQNAGAMGGAMSTAKVLWLLYAVLMWFFIAPIVAADPEVAPGLRRVLAVFAVCMWVRGVAELLLLYVFHAWQPPIGVAHDLLCIAILGTGLVLTRGPHVGTDLWVRALIAVLLASLCVEVLHASMFHAAVEGRTTGEDGLWFADEVDPRFRVINLLTTAFNVPLYAFLGAFLGRAFVRRGLAVRV